MAKYSCKKTVATLAACVLLAGCVSSGNQMGGAMTGTVLGGLAGSQFGSGEGQLVMTAAGAALGAMAGQSVGQSMDQAEAAYYGQAPASYQPYRPPVRPPQSW